MSVTKVLTIAGSDSLSGGGLQADLRTYKEYNIEGSNVLTCIVTVAPNTDEVTVLGVSLPTLKAQLRECLSKENEIDVIKIGMLADIEIAKVVANHLKKVKDIPIVLDPVLALKESGLTSSQDIIDFFNTELMPLATITTPNLREAELLSGLVGIDSIEKMEEAARIIHKTGVKNVVVKGGQRLKGETAYDVLFDGTTVTILEEKKLANSYNNGAGCTFASAIASGIATGLTVEESVRKGKVFVFESIEYGIPFLPGLGNVYQGGKNKSL